ncbi:MAG TPA: class I SAM-dependent methyltransferase [Pyrinomonadaceae bacterium]
MATEQVKRCKLCAGQAVYKFSLPLVAGLQGNYFECTKCRMLQSHHLDTLTVQGLIDLSNYSPDIDLDTGAAWRQFCIASRLHQLATARVLPDKDTDFKALDFGCGTSFLVSFMAHRFGWNAVGFDPYWTPAYAQPRVYKDWESVVRNGPYNLIIAAEVIEHFIQPNEELLRIGEILAKDFGFIYVTTGRYVPGRTTRNWEYLAPESGHHVTFYARQTMLEIARIMGAKSVYQVGAEYEWLFLFGDRHNWLKKANTVVVATLLTLATQWGILSKIE